MTILILGSGVPNKKYPGNGIFEFDNAKALSKIGLEIIYLSIDLRSIFKWRKWGVQKYKLDNVHVYSVNFPLGRVPFLIYDYIFLILLKWIYILIGKNEGKINLVHAHFLRPGYIMALANKYFKLPLVITEHSSDINKLNIEKRIFTRAEFAYRNCDKLIAVSPSLSTKINEKFNVISKYIPNILDVDCFKLSDKKKKEGYNFVSVGNLVYIKRMDLLINAFDKALSINSNATLTIIGDGPERNNLEKLIEEKRLQTKVFLKGLLTRGEIANYYDYCDCFVLASQSETFGVAYIEALAKGIPVIGTKCGGPEVFIKENNGILISVDDEKQLISSLKFMYKNIHYFDRTAISNDITTQFSPVTVAYQLKEVYEELLSQNKT